MVGVPRSKGCATCRRRKVACDQRKPQCLKCQNLGLRCEGYAQYATVIQWTPDGPKKRTRFEEVMSEEASQSSSGSPGALRRLAARPPVLDNAVFLPYQVDAGPVILQKIEMDCFASYLPPNGGLFQDIRSNWMYTILSMSALGRTLGTAFAAFSLARVGLVNEDSSMLSQAQSQYATALTLLQYDLNTPERAFKDRTLAAMRYLSIYEHLSPTFASGAPGRAHEAGMAQWCLAAGPESINSEFGLAVFLDVRWSIVNHTLDSRKGSVLGQEGWKTIPWQNASKDSLHHLFDIGFDLAAVLEKLDVHVLNIDSDAESGNISKVWSACSDTFKLLEDWYGQYWASIVQDRQNATPEIPEIVSASDATPQPAHVRFGSFYEASNLAYYWSYKLILNENIVKLAGHTSRYSTSPTPEPSLSSSSGPVSSKPRKKAAVGLSDPQIQQVSNECLNLATNILLSAPHFLSVNTGWLGPQRLFFPMQRSMQYLTKARSPLAGQARAAFFQAVSRLRSHCVDKAEQ